MPVSLVHTTNHDADPADPSPFVTEEGAERLTGGGISRSTFRNWRSAGKGPPFHRVGARVLYKRDEILSWIESGRVIPEFSTNIPQRSR